MRFRNLLLAMMMTALAPAFAATGRPDLRVEYRGWSIGSDGAKQEISYTERLYRRDGLAWIEREIPAAAQPQHDGHEHGGLGHRHADLAGAPLLIKRGADGKLSVQLVDHHQKTLYKVEAANYANVGFSGNWAEVYYLLDPADLPRLKTAGAPNNGVQQYELQRGTQTVRLSWNIAGEYAREIVSEDQRGLSGRTIKATPMQAPQPAPWTLVSAYRLRDYADLLD